ncbi:uncharacterized protein LOC141632211 [Silene latifolia]|uniref:uncharacterized protein LOC141632211 n=1 Tax=Silene latifolia TaxID=37657 RepID=UPI003D76EE5D
MSLEIKAILENTVNPDRKDWSGRLEDALWAYRTMKQVCNDEILNNAYKNAAIYKAKTQAWHDNMISRKTFEVGQKVLPFQNRHRHFSGKLRSRWMRPYEVVKVFTYGAIDIKCLNIGKVLKVNGQRLKLYHVGVEVGEVETLHLIDLVYDN